MKSFEDILAGLSPLVGEDLHPDVNNACVLVLNENIKIQLELDITAEFLLMASMIIDLPPGKFRENVLKSALKANNMIDQSPGILAFVVKANKLVLFDRIYTDDLTPEKLLAEITQFFHKAENWKNAIQGGNTAPLGAFPEMGPGQGPKLFGLK